MASSSSSGQRYTLRSMQPRLEVEGDTISWEVTTRNEIIRPVILLPLGVGVGIMSVMGVFVDGRRGALATIFGPFLAVMSIWYLIKVLSMHTTAQLRGNEFVYRTKEAPFLERERRVTPIQHRVFWEITNPIPSGCVLRLHGPTEETWYWRGEPFRTSRSLALRVPVPYFANYAQIQVRNQLAMHTFI